MRNPLFELKFPRELTIQMIIFAFCFPVYNFEKIPQVSSFHLGDFESQTRSANKSTGCMIGIVSNSCCIA
uniref:Uncharacterized protein n=1 Tax=Populus trichocarpa TaxID=3694 RepID=A0A2K2AJC4_POPTR